MKRFPVGSQLLKNHIKPVALEAGVPNIGWHSFRHTVSAWGKEAGLELEDVKTLRHENIATTSNVYGDIGPDCEATNSGTASRVRQAAGSERERRARGTLGADSRHYS